MSDLIKFASQIRHGNKNKSLNPNSDGPVHYIPWWVKLIEYIVILGASVGLIFYLGNLK